MRELEMKTYGNLAIALIVTILLVAIGPVMAQRDAGTAAQTEYQAIEVLLLARYLQLTDEQVKAIVPLATEIAQARTAFTTELDKLQEAAAKTLDEVITARAAGQSTGAASEKALQETVTEYQRAYEVYEQKIVAAGDKMLQLLTDSQQALIETPAETAEREGRLLTATVPPEQYMAEHLIMIRSLTRADYQAVRPLLARDVAMYIATAVDADAEMMAPLTEMTLEIMDQAMALSDAEFENVRPDLPQIIGESLQLPEQTSPLQAPARLTLLQLDEWLADPATAKLLRELQATETQSFPPPLYGVASPELEIAARRLWETTETRHKLEQSLDMIDILTVFNDLLVGPEQAAALLPQVTGLRTKYTAEQRRWRDGLVKERSQFAKTREALTKNQSLPDEQADALDRITEAEVEGAFLSLSAADEAIKAVQGVLDDEQRLAIDWRPPVCLAQGEPLEDKMERLLELSASISDLSRLLQQVRLIEPITYQSTAGDMTEQFLRRYMPPQVPGFDQAVRQLIDLQIQAREVPQEQWNDGIAALLSVEGMERLGLLPQDLSLTATPANPNAVYNWWDLEQILSDPLTLDCLKKMTQPPPPQG
jgi:Skp family chaperone for outer membrane proteins